MKRLLFILFLTPLSILAQKDTTIIFNGSNSIISITQDFTTPTLSQSVQLINEKPPHAVQLTLPKPFRKTINGEIRQMIPIGQSFLFKNQSSNSIYTIDLYKYDLSSKAEAFDSVLFIKPNESFNLTFTKGDFYHWEKHSN